MSYGVFKKGDEVIVADDRKQAIQLAFDGYAELPAEDLKGAELDAALQAADLPTSGKADEKRERLSTVKPS